MIKEIVYQIGNDMGKIKFKRKNLFYVSLSLFILSIILMFTVISMAFF